MARYPQGSRWRKWDLHIHTPSSIVQQYGGDTPEIWNAFVQRLAALPPEVKVIAVTDYLFCDGYERLLLRKDEIPNIELIIPNIEFRLDTFSGTPHHTKRHNFHVLFDPAISIQDIKDQFLNCLSTAYQIENKAEWRQTPTHRSLEQLGKQIKDAAPADNSVRNKPDLEVGFDNITYRREAIEELLRKDCFKGRFVTAIGYSEWDQSRWDQSAAEKRTLINLADFSLTNLDDPARIDDNRQDLIANKLNSLILHSSDAHEFDRVGQTLLWVKADPTFAGLKQVLNEPEVRVFIGEAPPNLKPDHRVISCVSIASSEGWFPDNFSLELNRDLVAIIGGRGSGKSALAEAIAYAAGSADDNEDAFLRKAMKHKSSIKDSVMSIEWADGTNTGFRVGEVSGGHALVRYLPQGVVEELCSHRNSEKLQRQIENVIFQSLDETERFGASDFEEMQRRILASSQYEKEEAVKNIRDVNRKIVKASAIITGLPDKRMTLEAKKKELEQLDKSVPTLPPDDLKGQQELAELTEMRKQFETKIVELQSQRNVISEIEAKVRLFRSQIEVYRMETSNLLRDIGITDLSKFDVNLDEDRVRLTLDEKRQTISIALERLRSGDKTDVSAMLGIPDTEMPFPNLEALDYGIERKQKETRAFETAKLQYQQQKKSASALASTITALEGEIAKSASEAPAEKRRLEQERVSAYCSYFELLADEKRRMEVLYKPIQESLLAGTDTDKRLVFEAKIDYRLDAHNRAGLEIIDRSRKGNFREQGHLKACLTTLWDECLSQAFDSKTIESQIDQMMTRFTAFEGNEIEIEDQLRENRGLEEFYNWLFDPAYFSVVSSLKFDGTDLYLLSPGQKGIILLMLFLEIDKADDRPLIIDQPEENLDNLSVYRDLIDYFRARKQYRQIIMVTHNPNLVVNTDAEQVIVANYDGGRVPRLMYRSGSLENQAEQIPDTSVAELEDGIIEQVCNILEGGERAFEKRKRKYQISRKSHVG